MNQTEQLFREIKFVPYGKEHDLKTVQWLNDPRIAKAFGLTHAITMKSHRKWIESQKNYYIWAIYDQQEIHQGNVSLTYNPKHHSAYFQLYIGEQQARGRGIGYTALLFAMKYAFETLNVHRLSLHVFPDNPAAIHLYQKAGFQKEGVEREAHYNDGHFRDQLSYSILYREWEERKGEKE
ncbi:GNAT family N-acetyltransferase [Lederbergia galactosidilytica]|uniref:GNAT family N-acetyltransferase n=1 Tax=Lederbergia galactosidilytica TaxID=217031 RepID=UPI0007DB4337|nr:GNAT family protein [Lederbergia galactosidilytica]MBP1917371.1 UDP-4-amino-4,6-dideoxy-N-acetyl-beta-L-altrosamine N-acetyltransferase [Lederbergia galactosidilytica]